MFVLFASGQIPVICKNIVDPPLCKTLPKWTFEYESQIVLQAPQQDMLKGSSYLLEAGFRPFAKILSSGGLSG